MLRQKFRYDEYEQFLKQKKYGQAQEYCSSFPKDQNAVICGWYAQYFLLRSRTDADDLFLELDASIRIIHREATSGRRHGYDKNALYLLGILLFERDFEADGDEVLTDVATLEKKREKLSEVEKNARIYLELHYFQKWENSQRIEDLATAADRCGHSKICYLYADKLREKGGCQDAADRYEFLLAEDYCAIWMDKATYNRNYIVSHLDQVRNDIRKDIGFIASDMVAFKESLGEIKSHLEVMLQKINDLPEATCNALHQEFDTFRTQMTGLSEQMEDQEETVCSLLQMVQSLDLDLQGDRENMRELKALVEQIMTAAQDREECLTQSIDGLKRAILDNLLLKDIVDEAAVEINGRFRERLSKDAKESIVTALFTLNFYKRISREQEPLIEYSGVVILAATALEIEFHNRLYAHFDNYITDRYGQENLNAWYRQPFTLGSFGFVVGIEPDNRQRDHNKQEEDRTQREQRFGEFIRDPRYRGFFSTDSGSLFQCGPNNKFQRRLLENFSKRLKDLRRIRNKAAHIEPVTLEEAEKACRLSFLSHQERAGKKKEKSFSLLEELLKSCK